MIFDYPIQRLHRRHGPAGYSDYDSYRDWLRDEFCFRCIYCLKRETWGRVTGDSELVPSLWFRQFTKDVKLANLRTCRHFRRIASKAKPDACRRE